MTTLTITPDIDKKRLKLSGVVASGEKVAVTVAGFGSVATENLQLRVMVGPVPVGMFPLEDDDVWTVSGADLTCTLNLATKQAELCSRHGAGAFFILEDTGTPQLYGFASQMLLPWVKLVGVDVPVDISNYKLRMSQLQAALDELSYNLAAHTGNTSNPHGVTKAQVGLGNVDNTSDADKPVSNAQQTAISVAIAVAESKYKKPADGIPKSDLSADVQTSLDQLDGWPIVSPAPSAGGQVTLQDRAINVLSIAPVAPLVWHWSDGKDHGTPVLDDGWTLSDDSDLKGNFYYIWDDYDESTGLGSVIFEGQVSASGILKEKIGDTQIVVTINGRDWTFGRREESSDVFLYDDASEIFDGGLSSAGIPASRVSTAAVGDSLQVDYTRDLTATHSSSSGPQRIFSLAFPAQTTGKSRKMLLRISVGTGAETVAWPVATYQTADRPTLAAGGTYLCDITEVASGVFYVDDLLAAKVKRSDFAALGSPAATINALAEWASQVTGLLKGGPQA